MGGTLRTLTYCENCGKPANGARNLEELRMFMENYFRGRAEQLRDEFLEANK